MRNGIDVASYQHPNGAPIDYRAVAASGVSWVAVKVDEGASYVNPYAADDVAGFLAAGCEVAVYHFARPASTTPADAAAHFTRAMSVQATALVRVLDFENAEGLSWQELATWAQEFQRYSGAQILYYNRDWQRNLADVGFAWSGGLWIAAPSESEFPPEAVAWQHGKGPVPGIEADTDLNQVLDPTTTGDDHMSAEDVANLTAHFDAKMADLQAQLVNLAGYDPATGQPRPLTENPTATDGSTFAGLTAIVQRIEAVESLLYAVLGYDQTTNTPKPTANTEDGSDVPGGSYAGLVVLRRKIDALGAPKPS